MYIISESFRYRKHTISRGVIKTSNTRYRGYLTPENYYIDIAMRYQIDLVWLFSEDKGLIKLKRRNVNT